MRHQLVIASAFIISIGCTPEISRNTYFCGPDALCPPNLSCQFGDTENFTYSCVLPREVDPFACPVPSADQEPDDALGQERDVGEVACGEQVQFQNWGCIDDSDDVDNFRFIRPTDCAGNDPRAKVTLRFPLGSAPLAVELVDESGQVLSKGEICTAEQDTTGTEQLCIDHRGIELGTYRVRITLDEEANADCNGQCSFNHYQLVIASPVS